VGAVSTRFDQRGAGLLDRGVTFASDLVQPVRTPRGGVVAFAGPFKSFGLLLIVEHGHEYHSLLAGMARLDVRVGDVVVAGQAIGSIAGSETMPARLYLELRHNGRPVNPLPWLAAREDKVRG
jgi:septal ring factor EnvC (AmiA/AmiB activator)